MTEKEKIKQRVIFLDLDGVVFNTKGFKKELAKIFYEHGGVDFNSTYQRNRFDNYSFNRHLAVIKGRDKRTKTRRQTELLLANSYKFIFPEVKDFLNRFRDDYLILLTRGETEFQQKKIFNLGINVFAVFSQVVTTEISKAEIVGKVLPTGLKTPGNVFFVDDTREEIICVKGRFDFITCVLMDRSRLFSSETDCSVDFIAKDLKMAGDFIDAY